MTDKQIKAVFRKISFTKILILVLEFFLFYSLFSNDTRLSLLVLSAFVILLNTLLINLWEAINEERLNNYDR
jgi:hypothetical protein